MTVAELTGRELEIAVAAAMGWFEPTDRMHPASTLFAPHYLSSPVAFASVLAALEASGRYWHFGRRFTYWAAVSREDLDEDWIRAEGDTYQEAMCRAVVAWKGQA